MASVEDWRAIEAPRQVYLLVEDCSEKRARKPHIHTYIHTDRHIHMHISRQTHINTHTQKKF
jgi:hypothetical protein